MKKISDSNKNPVGKPPFQPTDEQRKTVKAMVAFGIPYADICKVIINSMTKGPISTATLQVHFRDELDRGSVEANAKVGQSLYMQATGGGDWEKANITAAIWWSKIRMGWKETVRHEHRFDLSKLSDEELQAFERITAKASVVDGDTGRTGPTAH